MKLEKPIPKIKFGIDYFIQEQLNVQNWTNDLLLEKLDLSKEDYHKVLESKEPVTEEFANKLSVLFSTSATYWINIDGNYKKWLTKSANF
jgi:plasmid maintenance system antidote protein VapI